MSDPIWEGVYKSFQEAPACGTGFNSDTWISKSLEKISSIKKAVSENEIPYSLCCSDSPLSVLSSIVHSENGKINILDVGGGIGFSFYSVKESLPDDINLEFHIVDVEEVCTAGADFFKNQKNIFFHSELPAPGIHFDIVHLGSSLHYIEKWQEFLHNLCEYNADFVAFTDLPAGDIQSFVTLQNYYESKIPVWFFNIEEVSSEMNKNGYKRIFRSQYSAQLHGKEGQELPLANFPENCKLSHTSNLIFKKAGNQ